MFGYALWRRPTTADDTCGFKLCCFHKFRFDQPKCQNRTRHTLVFKFLIDRLAERVHECFGRIIDGLIGARHEARGGSKAQDLTFASGCHLIAELSRDAAPAVRQTTV